MWVLWMLVHLFSRFRRSHGCLCTFGQTCMPCRDRWHPDALTPDTDLVTVTTGGNDAGFSDIVDTCIRLRFTDPRGTRVSDRPPLAVPTTTRNAAPPQRRRSPGSWRAFGNAPRQRPWCGEAGTSAPWRTVISPESGGLSPCGTLVTIDTPNNLTMPLRGGCECKESFRCLWFRG